LNTEQQIEQKTETLPTKSGAGRKSKQDSRANELRQALIAWKESPEGSRPSLRFLALQLRTSHQLLTHFLNTIDEWGLEERIRIAKERMERIQARAQQEGRQLSWPEAATIIEPALLEMIANAQQEFKLGPLESHDIKMLKMLADRFPEAGNLLRKCLQDRRPRRRPKPLKVRKITEAQFHQIRLQKLVERFEEIGGVLLLDEGQVCYFVAQETAVSRVLVSELVNYREELKRVLELNPGKVDFGKVKAEICQRFPAISLSPLEPYST
jgi:hypothetical protein